MLKFKFLLWVFNQLLQRQIKNNPECARYVQGKTLVFQIRTAAGTGRYYEIHDGAIHSLGGITAHPHFTFTFADAAKGYAILSAKDSQPAFLRAVGSQELVVSGDFREVMWFQGLSAFLQPAKVVAPYNRTAF